jgi:class 3 adenylate cyclase
VPVPAVERKLAAIFAADIAGYSRLMGLDEAGTLARLKACREIMDRLIAAYRGWIFNTAVDRGAAVRQYERRPGAGIFCRRHGMSQTRRLAAILVADVAGYSRLMGAAEEATLERLKALRHEFVDPKFA